GGRGQRDGAEGDRHRAYRLEVPGGDGAEACGEKERGQQRGKPEDQVGKAVGAGLVRDVAEGEERAAKDEADEGAREERVEAGENRLEEQRKPGPAQDDPEHEPDVVDLPDRRHGVVDERPRLAAPLRAAGEQVPNAGAEIHATRRAVGGDREQEQECGPFWHQAENVLGRGPYGTPTSGVADSRRSSCLQRADRRSSRAMKKNAIRT